MEKYCQKKQQKNKETIVCLPYDMKYIYPFFCRNYDNIEYKELMQMGYDEFSMKLNSIPENDPLFTIFKSRAITLGKIKDKDERKYWRELKKENAIPNIYKSDKELETEMKFNIESLGGIKNGK